MSEKKARDCLRKMFANLSTALSANPATTKALAEGLFQRGIIPSETRLEISQSLLGGRQTASTLMTSVEAYLGTSHVCGQRGITALIEELKDQGLDHLSKELSKEYKKVAGDPPDNKLRAGKKRKQKAQEVKGDVKSEKKKKTKKARREIPEDSSTDASPIPTGSPSLASTSSSVSSHDEDTVPDMELGIDDLFGLLTLLKDVSCHWELIGLALHLIQPQLDAVKEDNLGRGQNRFLSAVLQKWLKWSYNTEKFGKPTWRMLVEALEGVEDCKPTANHIKQKKPWSK